MFKINVIVNNDILSLPEGSTPSMNPGNIYQQLLYCAGYPEKTPPLAELLCRMHNLEGRWVIVSPIHWQATHNDAMIVAGPQQLQLTDHQSRFLFEAYNAFVEPVHMRLFYHDASTWLLCCDGKPPINTLPVQNLLDSSILSYLQGLDKTLYWQGLITESQMFFNTLLHHQTQQQLPVNGVWFWGEGALNTPSTQSIVCDESMLEVGKCLSSTVDTYTSEMTFKSLNNNTILLLNHLTQAELNKLSDKLNKYAVYWYGSNGAYVSKHKNIFLRLWSRYAN